MGKEPAERREEKGCQRKAEKWWARGDYKRGDILQRPKQCRVVKARGLRFRPAERLSRPLFFISCKKKRNGEGEGEERLGVCLGASPAFLQNTAEAGRRESFACVEVNASLFSLRQ